MTSRMGSATARAPLEKPDWVKAPLFDQLFDQLEADRRWVVLELGGASTELLDLLSGYRMRVEIADLHGCGGLDMLNAATDAEQIEKLAEMVLPRHEPEAPIDVVFCWDLLNYLQPTAIAALARAIEARSRPGTLAHGLVVYSEREMPARPRRFRPSPERRLSEIRESDATIKAPRYSPEALSRTMGNFAIERAMLLTNGMQEFLFRL
jgi:hypothetical protein